MLRGPELFEDVRACSAPAAFWWLGQHTFILKLGEARLLIDPFLSDVEGREVPPLFAPEDACGVIDVVCCTHDHLDHIDPEAIPGLAACPEIRFVAPRAHTERMRNLGVPANRLIGLNDGETALVSGIRIHAVKAAHEQFHESPDGLYPFLGYVIEGGERVVYHAGDTVWWEGLQARLARWAFNVAFVPINGRDAERFEQDIVGNMTYQEAGDLLGGLDVGLSVPAHWDMFAFNSEDPRHFVRYMASRYPEHDVWVGGYAEHVSF